MQEKNLPNVKEKLLLLASHVNVKKVQGLADYLGVPSSTLYGWISRGKIADEALILKKISNINMHWIETGEGEMFADAPQAKEPERGAVSKDPLRVALEDELDKLPRAKLAKLLHQLLEAGREGEN